MPAQWTPMRWPDQWTDPSALDLLKGSSIDCLLLPENRQLDPVRTRASREGLHIASPERPPAGVTLLKGEWPGVRMMRGARGGAGAGPTGNPWIDSNGWTIRLAAALHPESSVWIDAPPPDGMRPAPGSYLLAVADSASRGGRWIVSLDPQLASAIAQKQPQAVDTWNQLAAATSFFAARKTWPEYSPLAVLGVISDFQGPNEFFSRELLNLSDRAGQHYRILPKDRIAEAALSSLRAVTYTDGEPPSPALRKQILAFVQSGGMLITGPKWGAAPGSPSPDDSNPRYAFRTLGKGRIALAHDDPDDPYLWANEAVVMVSHRYDLVRFWNGGATGSYCALSPDRKQAAAHLLFYANRGPDSASVRIAGRYRGVKAWSVTGPLNVESQPQKDAIEVRLPQVPQYVALELEV